MKVQLEEAKEQKDCGVWKPATRPTGEQTVQGERSVLQYKWNSPTQAMTVNSTQNYEMINDQPQGLRMNETDATQI